MALTKEERARRDGLARKGLKWCPRCSTAKSFSDFHQRTSARDGHRSECKKCEDGRQKGWAEANREHIRERDRKRYWLDPDKPRQEKRRDYYKHRAKRIADVQAQVDPEQKREYDREYRLRPEVRVRKRERQRRYQEEQREKYRAHYYVKNALRDGRLTRQPCEVCGAPHGEAHHDDYSKPLEVRWLCKAHHRATHAIFSKP